MLTIVLPELETYSEEGGFISYKKTKIRLEHSLYAISLWESKWKKPFFKNEAMSPSEFLYYVSCMPINDDVPENWWIRLDEQKLIKIRDYMANPMTATIIYRQKKPGGKHQTVTSELIYFWMTQFGIPFECDRWNINRLMTLLEVASIKNSKQKPMSKKEAAAQQQAICEANRRKYNSRG